MEQRKKKVLFHSNYPGMKTGFGGFMREIMGFLYNTGKYELAVVAGGVIDNHPDFNRWPWKTYGVIPNNQQRIAEINADPNRAKAVSYGSEVIDKAIAEFQPDVYIGSEDSWGMDFCKDRKWWGKIPCVVHTTIDSRPLLSSAIDLAKSTPHFYCWAEFATKEFHKQGLTHVQTLRGTVNTNVFRKLNIVDKREIRDRHGIPFDAFCIGMLSRNQGRKSFPNLIDGYIEFKKKNPAVKTRLLFFTHFSEGWNIPQICDERGVDKSEVLATYKCRHTGKYFIMPFAGQDLDNKEDGIPKSLITVNIQDGLTEEQINEWYNVLDVYCHPFTSGGQERSIQEAKLAELVTLVTNYSCGEDSCAPEAGSLPLDYAEYRETTGTDFIKASTLPHSISRQLTRVLVTDKSRREEMGRKAREWVIANFSIEVIGNKIEALLDSFPLSTYQLHQDKTAKNPDAVIEDIGDNREWLKVLYKKELDMTVANDDGGLIHWMQKLEQGFTRQQIDAYFRNEARKDVIVAESQNEFSQLMFHPDERLLITMPESLGDCLYLTCLLKDARELYPDKKIMIATKPQYRDVFMPLVGKYIDCVVDWAPSLDNTYALEGCGGHEKIFDIMLCPHFPTQRMINYLHNGHDQSKINLKYD